MEIDARIDRRLRDETADRIVRDRAVLDPTACRTDVQDRGRYVERLLDAIAPVFSGSTPPTLYVWGPKGAGKTTLTTAIVGRLNALNGDGGRAMHTTTRTAHRQLPRVVSVDLRRVSSEFTFYRRALSSLLGPEATPSNGVSTETLRDRLTSRLTAKPSFVVVDHVDDPMGPPLTDVVQWLSRVESGDAWVALGRTPPDGLNVDVERTVELPAYRTHTLIDVLGSRAEFGLAPDAITREQLYAIADWAHGDAHDAIAALFSAALLAESADRDRISEADVSDGIEAVPYPSSALHRVFALEESRQELLYQFLSLSASQRQSVGATAGALADADHVDLKRSTVRRMLYELADDGVLRRVEHRDPDRRYGRGRGRPPSRVEPTFPPLIFRALHSSRKS
ncbi:Cdc6/Cdc18 family protein [Natrarchaeobaculum sulfurireducens]|uniref:Orc1/cdc6 family replication initiation protein n=1 Tax=Natrarchaeobaculum sulfurireducens TaxID=2044521 RepID=A0A346PB08_9EURY|nr:AAA family ATPase [Natrarchaeobaculum sulfurireducens]AXR76703.1 Orc1/cdc6 family replication initiation protein [Natrarchaeobaculum sulfurireducens]